MRPCSIDERHEMERSIAETKDPYERVVRITALGLACYVIVLGASSLAGWCWNIPWLIDWSGSGISIKANTALCGLLSGLALLASLRTWPHVLVITPACIVVMIASATLVQHAAGIDLGIDELLFKEAPGALATAAPGRMGVPASTAFTCGGLVLLLSGADQRRPWMDAGAIITMVVSFLSVVGYLYGADQLYALPHITGIAFQTATMLFALGMGIALLPPSRGLPGLLISRGAGGVVTRRLVVPVILLPLVAGLLSVRGQQMGLYDTAFGTAAFALVMIVGLLTLVWWTGSGLEQLGRRVDLVHHALRASEERCRSALRASNTIAWSWEVDTARITLSENARELLGVPLEGGAEEFWAVVMPEDRTHAEAIVADALARKSSYELELRCNTADRGVVRMHYRGHVERDARGKAVRLIGTAIDVTERSAAQEALQEANKRKDRFLATLAHELRNPLAPLRSGLEVLRTMDDDRPEAQAVQGIMRRQLDHLVHLVDDLLDVGRITRGLIELRLAELPVSTIVNDSVESVGAHMEAKGHHLMVTDLPPTLIVLGDRTRLVQVLSNLLINAAKYTPVRGRITLAVRRDGSDVLIEVTDNGIGFVPQDQESIFEPFGQLAEARDHTQGGLGIGLHIVRHLLTLHRGSVHAQSEGPGKGSTFSVRLPLLNS